MFVKICCQRGRKSSKKVLKIALNILDTCKRIFYLKMLCLQCKEYIHGDLLVFPQELPRRGKKTCICKVQIRCIQNVTSASKVLQVHPKCYRYIQSVTNYWLIQIYKCNPKLYKKKTHIERRYMITLIILQDLILHLNMCTL